MKKLPTPASKRTKTDKWGLLNWGLLSYMVYFLLRLSVKNIKVYGKHQKLDITLKHVLKYGYLILLWLLSLNIMFIVPQFSCLTSAVQSSWVKLLLFMGTLAHSLRWDESPISPFILWPQPLFFPRGAKQSLENSLFHCKHSETAQRESRALCAQQEIIGTHQVRRETVLCLTTSGLRSLLSIDCHRLGVLWDRRRTQWFHTGR
jgi:hypothetical protein